MSTFSTEPFSDDHVRIGEAIQDFASYIGCPEAFVHAAMKGLMFPSSCSPEHQNAVREATNAHNLALQHAEQLVSALSNLSETDQQLLVQAGCVTRFQIGRLCEELTRTAKHYEEWDKRFPRTGGRNHAALSVAKMVLRVFRIMGKKLTWGTRDGFPTTDYGRAVQYALAAFGVKSGWKQAARVVYDEHDRRKLEATGTIIRNQIGRLNTNST